jgi:hypothetical protein
MKLIIGVSIHSAPFVLVTRRSSKNGCFWMSTIGCHFPIIVDVVKEVLSAPMRYRNPFGGDIVRRFFLGLAEGNAP